MNLKDMSDNDLEEHAVAVDQERKRRATLASAEERMDEISRDVLTAEEVVEGEPWVQPVTVGYPKDWHVTHDGQTWTSTVSNNVWEPGYEADPQSYRWWKSLDDQPSDGEWNPNGHDYSVGNEVTYAGKAYRCRQAHTSQPGWAPDVAPALWEEA